MLVVPPSRPEGTVDLTLIRASQEIVFRPWVWHPDQVPYVVVWRDLVEDPSGFLPRQVKVLAAAEDWPTKTPSVPKPEILQRRHTEEEVVSLLAVPRPWCTYSTTSSTANSAGSSSTSPGCFRGKTGLRDP